MIPLTLAMLCAGPIQPLPTLIGQLVIEGQHYVTGRGVPEGAYMVKTEGSSGTIWFLVMSDETACRVTK